MTFTIASLTYIPHPDFISLINKTLSNFIVMMETNLYCFISWNMVISPQLSNYVMLKSCSLSRRAYVSCWIWLSLPGLFSVEFSRRLAEFPASQGIHKYHSPSFFKGPYCSLHKAIISLLDSMQKKHSSYSNSGRCFQADPPRLSATRFRSAIKSAKAGEGQGPGAISYCILWCRAVLQGAQLRKQSSSAT